MVVLTPQRLAEIKALQRSAASVPDLDEEEFLKAVPAALLTTLDAWSDARDRLVDQHIPELAAEIERLWRLLPPPGAPSVASLLDLAEEARSEVAEWRKAASYLVGPADCLNRECGEYRDDAGDDRPDVQRCSHLVERRLTPDEVGAALERTAEGWIRG